MHEQFTTEAGVEVEVIRRPLPLIHSELIEDLRPFFHVPSLLQYANTAGVAPASRGRLLDLETLAPDQVAMTFGSKGAPHIQLRLSTIRSRALTIWRVNDVLDALQVLIVAEDIVAYLQTGGDALLHSLADLQQVGSHNVKAVELFNEPILMLREWVSCRPIR